MTRELNFESMTYKAFSIKGGLCIFEQDNLSLEILDDLTNISDTLEFFSVEIKNKLSNIKQ